VIFTLRSQKISAPGFGERFRTPVFLSDRANNTEQKVSNDPVWSFLGKFLAEFTVISKYCRLQSAGLPAFSAILENAGPSPRAPDRPPPAGRVFLLSRESLSPISDPPCFERKLQSCIQKKSSKMAQSFKEKTASPAAAAAAPGP
jgi:hypothetical protein